jgi:hypothetical protein
MSATSPELTNAKPSLKGPEKTIYDDLAEIAKQQRLETELAKQAAADAEASEATEHPTETDPLTAEVDAEQLAENEKYLADLMHHMKSQQPEIYYDALAQLAAEKNTDSEQGVTPEDLDAELEEKLAKQGSIPADLLAEMTDQMRDEEMRADSTAWKEVSANSMVGDIARRWRDMYQKAMAEIIG